MSDSSLRLPNTLFQAVLNLGQKRASGLILPARFSDPALMADYNEEDGRSEFYVEFVDGQIHFQMSASGSDFHFHGAFGEEMDASPWGPDDTASLVAWAQLVLEDFHSQMPELRNTIEDAAGWYDEGFTLYVCEVTEPAHLDLLEVEVEGEMLTLPWLGSGQVEHEHIDGVDHPIELLWTPQELTPATRIATAWLDRETEEPRTAAAPGVDWVAVGLSQTEVLSWLDGIYLNHHVIPDIESLLVEAVLRTLGGITA